MDAAVIARCRAETPGCRARCHLNNAGASLMPQAVITAIRDHLELEAMIGGYEAADLRAAVIDDAYAAIAELIGAAPRQIAMVENATVAFAQALSAIPFASGDVILTTENDYVSNQIMFLSLARRCGVEVVRAPDAETGGVDLPAFAELLRRRRPRLVAVTHIPTSSGLIQPVGDIGRLCREADVLYLVDACQSVGQLPLDVAALGCDFLSATCRKFLRGPRGAGFLYVSDRVLEAGYEPLFLDLRGAEWTAPDLYRPRPDARRFENWEFAYALVVGSGAAARYALDLGLPAIAERSADLAGYARQRLRTLPGVTVVDRGAALGAIVTAAVDGWQPEALKTELHSRSINISITDRLSAVIDLPRKGVAWVARVSPHYFNTEAEIDALVAALEELQTR